MDELEIQGKKYISSKRASELTGYAKDYVGQLVRSNKVPGVRVGRSWYVGLDELKAHAGTPNQDQVQEESAKFSTWGNVTYLEDTSTLVPPLVTKQQEDNNQNLGQKIIINKGPNSIAASAERTMKNTSPISVLPAVYKTKNVSYLTTPPGKPITTKFPISLTSAVTFSLAILFFTTLLAITSQWSYQNSSILASASFSFETDFEIVFEYFEVFFDVGVALIASFLNLLLDSIAEFFNLGFEYLTSLFN